MEIRYLFKIETVFTVCLKSPNNIMQTSVLSGLRTATMGAAHSAVSTDSKLLKCLQLLSNSALSQFGHVRSMELYNYALQY